MLSVAKVGRGGVGYYLSTLASERGDTPGLVEPDGVWLGTAAANLGLEGCSVDRGHLTPLLDGIDPTTGEFLDSHHDRVRVVAYDCTFAAPKSVSLLHALGAPEVVNEVRAAHESSVRAALDYLEHDAARVRNRRGGADELETTSGLVAASFVHRISRAPDPHLHSHVLVANLGCHEDGRWTALDARPLFTSSGTTGALYRAQLRDELVRRLDVAWRWRADGFADLAGVRPEVVRAFSRRSEEIARGLAESGSRGRRAARVIAQRTKAPKDLDVPYEKLVESWRERAYETGISAGRLSEVADSGRIDGRRQFASPRRIGARDVTTRPFTRRELLAARSDELVDGAQVIDIVAGVDAEITLGNATGAITLDPERPQISRSFVGRTGARIPGGLQERVMVTRSYLECESRVVAELRSAPELGLSTTPQGIYVVSSDPRDAIGAAQRIRPCLEDAIANGRTVAVATSSAGSTGRNDALFGIKERLLDELPNSLDGMVIVLDNAQAIDATSMAKVFERGRGGVIVVMNGPSTGGRRVIGDALASRDPPGVVMSAGAPRDESRTVADAGLPREHDASAPVVRLVATPNDLANAVVEEQLRLAARSGDALIVTGDHSLARQLSVLTGRQILSPTMAAAQARELPHAAVVVVGGAAILGRSSSSLRERSRVHVAVAPPGGNSDDIERWGAHLLTSRQRGRERVRDGRERYGAEHSSQSRTRERSL